MAKARRPTFLIVIAVVFAAIGAIWFGASRFDEFVLGSTRRVGAYQGQLRAWSETGLVAHFPKVVPRSATHVSLAAYAGFFSQGGGTFQLRLRLPPEEVRRIEADVKSRAVRACPPQCSGYVEDPDYWHVPWLLAGEDPEVEFPPSFTIYALSTDGDWNHPTGGGIAVSAVTGEVVYWAQQ